MLCIKSLYVSYAKKQTALKKISLTISPIGFISIIGESGSGKTTFLKCLSKNLKYKGLISIDGKDIQKFSKKEESYYKNKFLSFLTQDFSLIDELNVKENIVLPFSLRKEKIVETKLISVLNSLNLSENFLDKKINELSQGERQRVALARVILNDSQIILCDEPTGNLDSKNSREIYTILKKLSQTKLVIVVSHNDYLTEEFSDRIIRLDKGEIIEDKIINKKENISSYFDIKDNESTSFNKFSLKITNRLIIKKLPLTLIIIFLTALCTGFLSTFIDIRMFDPTTRIQQKLEESDLKAIQPTNLQDENSTFTLYDTDLEEFRNYCNKNEISNIPLYNNSLFHNLIMSLGPSSSPYFNQYLSFASINDSLINEFNLKIVGKMPEENEFLISLNVLYDLEIVSQNSNNLVNDLEEVLSNKEITTEFSDYDALKHTYQASGVILTTKKEETYYLKDDDYYDFSNMILFNDVTFNNFVSLENQYSTRLNSLIFSSHNNGYIKAASYQNNKGEKLVFDSIIIQLATRKESTILVLSVFSIVIIIFLLIINLMVFFNYLYTQKITNNKTFSVLENCGATKKFINLSYLYLFSLVFFFSLIFTQVFNLICNNIFNAISYVSGEPVEFNIAYFEPVTILISVTIFILFTSIGLLYFNIDRRKKIY